MIYLDYAASSPPFAQVIDEMSAVATAHFGNPSAIHRAGSDARQILQNSRIFLARLTNVRPEEIYFTSGGTESNNWAVATGCAGGRKKHIICSAAEHSSVLEPVRQMQRKGYDVTYLNPVRSGCIPPEALEAALRPDTALVCIQAINNETGVIQDVDAFATLAHKHGARYLCDAVQSFGHLRQNLHKADLITLSAHKLGGPRGIGCLIARQPVLPTALLTGGGQEFGLRAGTENLPAIAGFARAAALSDDLLMQEQSHLTALRVQLEDMLRSAVPGLEIAGEAAARAGILCCAFPGITAEEMVARLDLAGICASPGAACAARSGKPSHVLLSMGYSPAQAARFVRFSPGRNTTAEEIYRTVAAIEAIMKKRS